jgi:UDP-N-acetylglucosamine--N-acetylmuramyl-(pentapeptide) pyrophosphoryl-undecaprenol N-acetylglucosamine transferase
MGGFVAGPGGIAAWLSRRPLLIHEQNAVAGTTNRLLARFATRVFAAFPQSFATARAETIGNPVRVSIIAAGQQRQRAVPAAVRHLLVFGGSQGALALNRLLPAALALIEPARRPRVRHQAGRFAAETAAAYRDAGVEADVVDFIDDMAAAYSRADLAVTRAGALTISELAAAGVGALLVPLPHAIDDHQNRNAEAFVAGGAGRLLPERETDAATMAQAIIDCLDAEVLNAMSAAAHAQARTAATEILATACLEAAGGHR